MMPNKSGDMYKFRQRAGRIEWNNISKIDIDDVIGNGRLGDLQSILDNVTFSEITLNDIGRDQGPGSVLKLVQSMQLMLEYVLQGQEFQAGLVTKMHSKYGPLKKKVSRLETENVFLKEDIKVYKRQLAGLRSRLQAEGKDTDLPSDYGVEDAPESPIRNALPPNTPGSAIQKEKEKHKNSTELGHAGDVRELVMELFSKHRSLDGEEIHKKMESMQASLLSAIETLQQQASTANANNKGASPLRKKVKKDEGGSMQMNNNHTSSITSTGGEGLPDDCDDGDRSFNLSISSSGTSISQSPSLAVSVSTAPAPHVGASATKPKKQHYSQVMSPAVLQTAADMERDLRRELELATAKKEAELAEREKEVAEKLNKIHLIEKSVLQSQVVMERERLALAEERFALTPLKALKQEIALQKEASVLKEEARQKAEEERQREVARRKDEEEARQVMRDRSIAAKIIKARLANFTWKKLLNRFRKWVTETLNKRDMEAFKRQQDAMKKVQALEVASKEAAHESEEKELELKERLQKEREELENHNRLLDEKRAKEKEEDERRHAALVALETERVRLETERRVEEEKQRQQAQEEAVATARRRVADVQTSLDFTVITEKDDEEHRKAKLAVAALHRDLGLDDSREMTDEEVFLKAQRRVESYGASSMPSKLDLKRQLELEMRGRLESKVSAMKDKSSTGTGTPPSTK